MAHLYAMDEPPPSQALLDRYLKELEAEYTRATKHAKALTEFSRKMRGPKITAKLGQIPERVYLDSPIIQSDIISKLPGELQSMIWQYLNTDADRIALALTCKTNARMFENLKHLQKVRQAKRPSSQHRLMVLLRLIPWMRPNDRLCFSCIRFCDRKKGGWGGDSKFEAQARQLDGSAGKPVGICRKSPNSTIPKHAEMCGPRCSNCVAYSRWQQLKHKQIWKDAAKLAKTCDERVLDR